MYSSLAFWIIMIAWMSDVAIVASSTSHLIRYYEYMEHQYRAVGHSSLGPCLREQNERGPAEWVQGGGPMYVALAGVEGSGHHLLAPVFRGASDSDGVRRKHEGAKNTDASRSKLPTSGNHTRAHSNVFVNEVHSFMWPEERKNLEVGLMNPQDLMQALWRNTKHYSDLFENVPPNSNVAKDDGANEGIKPEDLVPHLTRQRIRLFNGGGSHPFGQPRSPWRFPDLWALRRLEKELDVRTVFLYRNASAASLSVLRRGFADDLEFQARVAELDLVYLDALLRAWPCRKALLLNYDFALADPLAAGAALAQLVDADSALATKLSAHLVGAVRSFGHSLNRAFTPPSRHLDNDHKIKSASSLGHSDIFESRHVQEPLNSQRRRRLRGKQIEAVLSHRYQNLVKMQWCRKRNLSDPESCANAVRVELNDFFGARVALFGTLAGTEPY